MPPEMKKAGRVGDDDVFTRTGTPGASAAMPDCPCGLTACATLALILLAN
jgi:hypothetical protein